MNSLDLNSVFEPIEHDSVADEVVEQIESLIISGVLKDGRKLPAEREMAEVLKVSRPKLREALKTLEARKLLEIRHGGGSFVAPLVGKAMSPALMDLYARHPVAFFDYLEYRREQEAFAARLAAVRATDADKVLLKRIMNTLIESHREQDLEVSKKADIDFHMAIVDAANNATLAHIMSSIYELTMQGLFYNRDYLRSIDGSGDRLLEQHLTIGQAILDGKADDAAAAAIAHMDFVEQSYRMGHERSKRERFALKRLLLSSAESK